MLWQFYHLYFNSLLQHLMSNIIWLNLFCCKDLLLWSFNHFKLSVRFQLRFDWKYAFLIMSPSIQRNYRYNWISRNNISVEGQRFHKMFCVFVCFCGRLLAYYYLRRSLFEPGSASWECCPTGNLSCSLEAGLTAAYYVINLTDSF